MVDYQFPQEISSPSNVHVSRGYSNYVFNWVVCIAYQRKILILKEMVIEFKKHVCK